MIFTTLIKTLLAGVVFVSSVIGEKVTPHEIIQQVNTHPTATWKAEVSQWTEMEHADAKALLGTQINYHNVFRTDFALNRGSANGIECSLCTAALDWVEGKIAGNYSVSKIESLLTDVCDLAPTKSLKASCAQLVQVYTPQLVQYLLNKESPATICQQIGICQQTLMAHMHSMRKLNYKGDLKCIMCNYVMEWSEHAITDNSTVEHIESFLDMICDKLPKTYGSLCNNLVEMYTPELIQYILNKETPQTVCDQLQLCPNTQFSSAPIPDNFDGRQVFGSCIHPVRNQEKCGSCWAFSASEVLSDRFCIFSKKSIDVILSPEDMVACDTQDHGCDGGMLNTAWDFLTSHGLVTDACMPYTSGDGTSGSCPTTCADGSNIAQVYKAKSSRHVWSIFNNVAAIQQEVMNGPVQAAFEVYQDFMGYKSGVYHHVSGSLLGGHAVEMVGWGVENGTPYWLIKNSWTDQWGDQGYFKILRGKNECGIEADIYAGVPLINAY